MNPAPPGLNWMGDLQAAVTALVTTTGNTLVPFGQLLLAVIVASRICLLVIRGTLSQLDFWRRESIQFGELVILLLQAAAAATFLQYYSTALPGMSISFHQILPWFGQQLTNVINTTYADRLIAEIANVIKNLQRPSVFNFLECAVYVMIFVDMAVLQIAIFCVSAFGFIGMGIYTLFGPLAIAFFPTRSFNKYFWTWIENMAMYSLYPAIGAAISFIFGMMLTNFFSNTIHGVYTIGRFLGLIPILLTLTVSFVFSIFKVPSFASKLTHGVGDAGQSVVNSVVAFVGGRV